MTGPGSSGISLWLAGARIKTLPAAAVPVAVGTAVAADLASGWAYGLSWWRALLALLVAVALQVGTNYANDYSDGVRGTDEQRVGPLRLVGSGLVEPKLVKAAAFSAFGVAGIAGLALASVAGWELLIVGAVSFLAGWFYTGGKHPYGYMGLGEVFVFVFFGLVATAGSAYVQTETLSGLGLLAGTAVGFLACALLVTNNLRDIPTDSQTGKRTLAVRMGDRATRLFYVALVVGAFAAVLPMAVSRPFALIALGATPLAFAPIRTVLQGATGLGLVPVLVATGKLQMAYGFLLTVGLLIAS